MTSEFSQILLCPKCQHVGLDWRPHPSAAAVGVVSCSICSEWYPVEKGVVDLLVGELGYEEDRRQFFERHHDALRLERPAIEEDGGGPADEQRLQQKHFDKWAIDDAQSYTAYNQSPFWRNMDKEVMDQWRSEIRPGDWILDVGCGDARASINFASCDATIVGFDVSKRLVEVAAARFAELQPRARSLFLAADATRFPLRSQQFDRVVLYGVLHHLPDVEAGCREVARVLKERGVYYGHENNATIFRGIFDWLQRLWPQWTEEAGAEPLLRANDLTRKFERYGVQLESRSCVFVPPHLVNILPDVLGRALYNVTNRIGQALPVLRKNGGILLMRGQRSALS